MDDFDEPVLCHYSYLYIIWNIITKKGYGGQTRHLAVRMNVHEKMRDGCTYLNRSIKKHGWENFSVQIVAQGWWTQDERNAKEIALIAKHNFFGGGYNLTKGGGGCVGKMHSDVTKAKMSLSTTGMKHSEETRAKLSAARTGNNNPNFGKKASAETRAKISAAQKGKMHSAETKAKISVAITGKKRKAGNIKRVLGKRKHQDDDAWVEFESNRAAAEHFKCNRNTVSDTVNKKSVSSKFDFKYP